MKFVALVSGGKDSFYNVMHCMQNGHTLVALANLHPREKKTDELDLFMFQTVGHDVIDHYRECVDVPLYRQAITGTSANVALEYEPTQNDEIEDLYLLLQEVKLHHPDVEGVSCGAILSHYQRTRVENVCDRLGLTSLAYLWQRDQLQLMREMCELGLDARLVKVAAVGLTEKHLGKSILDMAPILHKLNMMYDVHVCGEGGEFETLVFDAPFFTKKLSPTETSVVSHSLDVLYLRATAEVVPKEEAEIVQQKDLLVVVPHLLDDSFDEVLTLTTPKEIGSETQAAGLAAFSVAPTVRVLASRIYVCNVVGDGDTIEAQTASVMSQLARHLAANGTTFAHVQHMTVLVQDMALFARMNAVYGESFAGLYLPPSRVCVETKLAAPYMVQVSCVAMRPKVAKTGIHIRSRSYWAPQNIGPYSQAIVENRETFKTATLSGQIPLVPALMALDPALGTADSAVLALQHLYRVKSLVGVRQLANCICYVTQKDAVPVVAEVWKHYVDEVEHGQDFYNRLIIVQASGLPRGATVEWSGLAHEKVVGMYDDDEQQDEKSPGLLELAAAFDTTAVPVGDGVVVSAAGDDFDALVAFLRNPSLASTYISVMADLAHIHKLSSMGLRAEWLPVSAVWDSKGVRHGFGMVWIS